MRPIASCAYLCTFLAVVFAGCGSESKRQGPPLLTYTSDEATGVYEFHADGKPLAVYQKKSATFTAFFVNGQNLIGGYSSGEYTTSNRNGPGGAAVGHSSDYPFGRYDVGDASSGNDNKSTWEGFWAGYDYMDHVSGQWHGIPGMLPKSFEIERMADGRLDIHVVTEISSPADDAHFECDVHYYLSTEGIGVRDEIQFLSDIRPNGLGDTGGQLIMTQVDSDLDPSLAYDQSQPSLYFKLALDDTSVDIDPFPPYCEWTPSNEYGDFVPGAKLGLSALPNGALVPMDQAMTYLSPFGRKDRDVNLALRIDLSRSTLPPLEYYSEINGERDYDNFNFTASIGDNTTPSSISKGTAWLLYGDLRPWTGSDPTVLRKMPMLSDGAP